MKKLGLGIISCILVIAIMLTSGGVILFNSINSKKNFDEIEIDLENIEWEEIINSVDVENIDVEEQTILSEITEEELIQNVVTSKGDKKEVSSENTQSKITTTTTNVSKKETASENRIVMSDESAKKPDKTQNTETVYSIVEEIKKAEKENTDFPYEVDLFDNNNGQWVAQHQYYYEFSDNYFGNLENGAYEESKDFISEYNISDYEEDKNIYGSVGIHYIAENANNDLEKWNISDWQEDASSKSYGTSHSVSHSTSVSTNYSVSTGTSGGVSYGNSWASKPIHSNTTSTSVSVGTSTSTSSGTSTSVSVGNSSSKAQKFNVKNVKSVTENYNNIPYKAKKIIKQVIGSKVTDVLSTGFVYSVRTTRLTFEEQQALILYIASYYGQGSNIGKMLKITHVGNLYTRIDINLLSKFCFDQERAYIYKKIDKKLNNMYDGSDIYILEQIALIVARQIKYTDGERDVTDALIGGKGVCVVYAMLFKMMGERAGIEVDMIGGFAKPNREGRHSWNLAHTDYGDFYYDITWFDRENEEWNYKYLCSSKPLHYDFKVNNTDSYWGVEVTGGPMSK